MTPRTAPGAQQDGDASRSVLPFSVSLFLRSQARSCGGDDQSVTPFFKLVLKAMISRLAPPYAARRPAPGADGAVS
jgi:hypothetical protein